MRRLAFRSGAALGFFALAGAFVACSEPAIENQVTSTGGSNSGGTAGTPTGGSAPGGSATGGSATGGSATGGSAGSATGATGGTVAGSSGAGTTGGSGGASSGAGGTAGSSGGGASGASTTGGASGASGAAGSAPGGSGGASGGSGGAPVGSTGCGKAVTQMARQWVEGTPLDVMGAMRRFWTYLPNNYDPMRRYPVVFLFHGCGTETNNVPMQNVVGENAILVRSKAVTDCWDTGTNSPDIAFFDALVAAVDASLCVDTSRRFAVGYSSGSWLINTLECVRGGVLRAAASVAGGSPRRNANACTGPTLARLFIHDFNDPENAISGSITERDRLLTANACPAAAPVPEDPAPCARYQGCTPGYPVIWCETMGQMHGRQDQLASTAAWRLFTEF